MKLKNRVEVKDRTCELAESRKKYIKYITTVGQSYKSAGREVVTKIEKVCWKIRRNYCLSELRIRNSVFYWDPDTVFEKFKSEFGV